MLLEGQGYNTGVAMSLEYLPSFQAHICHTGLFMGLKLLNTGLTEAPDVVGYDIGYTT